MTTSSKPPKRWRRQLIVDTRMQFSVLFVVIGTLVLSAFLCVGASVMMPGPETTGVLTAQDVQDFALKVNAVYALFCLMSLGWVAVVMTHRIAGPARVLTTAVEAFARGDYKQRLTLRKGDYLKPLAAALRRHAESLEDSRERITATTTAMREAIQDGQSEQALEMLTLLEAEYRVPASQPQSQSQSTTAEPASAPQVS